METTQVAINGWMNKQTGIRVYKYLQILIPLHAFSILSLMCRVYFHTSSTRPWRVSDVRLLLRWKESGDSFWLLPSGWPNRNMTFQHRWQLLAQLSLKLGPFFLRWDLVGWVCLGLQEDTWFPLRYLWFCHPGHPLSISSDFHEDQMRQMYFPKCFCSSTGTQCKVLLMMYCIKPLSSSLEAL